MVTSLDMSTSVETILFWGVMALITGTIIYLLHNRMCEKNNITRGMAITKNSAYIVLGFAFINGVFGVIEGFGGIESVVVRLLGI